jgi:hypothetical protein
MRRTNKCLFGFIIMLFCIYQISAITESLGTQKQGDCVLLPQTCYNCSYVNITSVQYPNSSLIVLDVNMTQYGSQYSYEFCDTQQLGKYIVNTEADGIVAPYDFVVTPSGVLQTTSQGIGSAIFLITMLVLTFLFGFIGFKLSESEYLWILGIFFMFLSVLFIVYDVWLGYEFHRNFTGMSNSAMPEMIFYIFMLLLVLGLLVSVLLLFLHWKKVFKYIKREIKPKEEEDVDFEDEDFQ